MVVAKCMFTGCSFETENMEPILAAQILESHSLNHKLEISSRNGRAERMKRPSVSCDISQQEFSFFLRDWALYERYLSESEIASELITSCDDELRRCLYRNHSEIEKKNKEVILEAIKSFAVKSESFVVHQVNHIRMCQGRDEPIKKFVARLKGQASVCEYTTKCACTCECPNKPMVDYGDKALRQIIAANIYDIEIQKDLLSALNSRKNQMTVDEMVNFIEGKENGNESAMKLSVPQSVNVVHSSYKRSMKPPAKSYSPVERSNPTKQNNNEKICSHCGEIGHGNHWGYANSQIRKKLGCPAYNKMCLKCNKMGHFASVCRANRVNKQVAAISEGDGPLMMSKLQEESLPYTKPD